MTVSGSSISENELGVTPVDGAENDEFFEVLCQLLFLPLPSVPLLLEGVGAMGSRRDSTMQSAFRTIVSLGGL